MKKPDHLTEREWELLRSIGHGVTGVKISVSVVKKRKVPTTLKVTPFTLVFSLN